MDTSIITGIISGAVTLVVCLINNYFQRIESEKKHEANIMLISYRLEQLEKKVDKHNEVIDRTYALEKRTAVTEEQINEVNHRVSDLEKEGV